MLAELDPHAIRLDLETSRLGGLSFERAWLIATGRERDTDPRSVFAFMKKHFRAAYYNSGAKAGRCTIPPRETYTPPVVAATQPRARNAAERCRSGDGCDRRAVRGQFGPRFCDHHGAELERLAESLQGGSPYTNSR